MTTERMDIRLESKHFDCEKVQVRRLEGREHISQLFEFEVDFITTDDKGLSVDDLAGADVTLVMTQGDHEVRRHGMVTRVDELMPTEAAHWAYRLAIGPHAWITTLVETLDLYLDSTVPEIIEKKLTMIGLSPGEDFEFRLTHTFPKRELVVQYRETDLAFISRLCEHLGICFFFEHDGGKDKLVFNDGRHHNPIAGGPTAPFYPRGEHRGVFALERRRNLIPAFYVCRDYNYRTPTLELHEDYDLEGGFAGGVVDFGGHFENPDEGKRLAQVRAEERLATRDVYSGKSDLASMSAGCTLEIDNHPKDNPALLLVEVEHHAEQSVMADSGEAERSYHNRFHAVPSSNTFRPPRVTAVPRISGLVTGIIENRQGDLESYAKLDDQGRYLVRFLFDTTGPGGRHVSCRVRMMQKSAGPGYGTHFPLKPGVEVKVAFTDGNPDRPIIVAAVPNPVTSTPVAASDHTKNRILTRAGVLIEIDDGDVYAT